MKKVLILGAGIYQVPLIRAAKRAGMYTIVTSIPGEWPGFEEADKSYCVNTTDKEGVLRIAMDEQIDGICTTGTDVAIATIGYVNESLKLAGISEAAAFRASDKFTIQEAFHKGGVSSAEFIRADSAQKAAEAAEIIGFPVVVKCVDSSGNRGITRVDDPGNLQSAYEEALRYSRKNYVIVEKMLTGTEIGVDGLIQNGEIVFQAPHSKIVRKRNNKTITTGHSFPYHGDRALIQEIGRQISKAVNSMGFDDCAFNADVFVDGDKVSIIEIGGRAGATCIPELITSCYGFDYYKQIICLAFGEPLDFSIEHTPSPCMAKLIMSPVDGSITKIDQGKIERLRDNHVNVQMDFPVGHDVESADNGSQRIGQFIVEGQGEEAAETFEKQVNRCVYVNGKTLDELWQIEEQKK